MKKILVGLATMLFLFGLVGTVEADIVTINFSGTFNSWGSDMSSYNAIINGDQYNGVIRFDTNASYREYTGPSAGYLKEYEYLEFTLNMGGFNVTESGTKPEYGFRVWNDSEARDKIVIYGGQSINGDNAANTRLHMSLILDDGGWLSPLAGTTLDSTDLPSVDELKAFLGNSWVSQYCAVREYGGKDVNFNLHRPSTFTVTQTPVPVPGAIWLLASGLVGLVGIRRKRFEK